jgi:TPR repeat protein
MKTRTEIAEVESGCGNSLATVSFVDCHRNSQRDVKANFCMANDGIISETIRASGLLASGNIEAAYDILHHDFDGSNPKIAVLLGYIYGEDNFSRKDEEKSLSHYLIAAEAGDAYAQQAVAAIFRNRGEEEKALFWLTKASNSGNYDASLLLFYYHRNNQNREEAFKFLLFAADQGNVEAMQRYAIEMLKGNYGVAKIPLGLVTCFSNIPALFRYAKEMTKNSLPPK